MMDTVHMSNALATSTPYLGGGGGGGSGGNGGGYGGRAAAATEASAGGRAMTPGTFALYVVETPVNHYFYCYNCTTVHPPCMRLS